MRFAAHMLVRRVDPLLEVSFPGEELVQVGALLRFF